MWFGLDAWNIEWATIKCSSKFIKTCFWLLRPQDLAFELDRPVESTRAHGHFVALLLHGPAFRLRTQALVEMVYVCDGRGRARILSLSHGTDSCVCHERYERWSSRRTYTTHMNEWRGEDHNNQQEPWAWAYLHWASKAQPSRAEPSRTHRPAPSQQA